MNTPTPRTDAVAKNHSFPPDSKEYGELRDHAEQIERELAECRAELDLAKQARDAMVAQEQASRNECNRLRAELTSADAKCAEMGDYIENWADKAPLPLEMWEKKWDMKQHALSSDCGKNWKSPTEYEALETKCAELLNVLKAHHDKDQEELLVYFKDDDVDTHPTNLGEAYAESTLADLTTHALGLGCGQGWSRVDPMIELLSYHIPKCVDENCRCVEELGRLQKLRDGK